MSKFISHYSLTIDKRKLDEINDKLPGRAKMVLQKLAFDAQAWWQTHFSPSSPSLPGQPPAVVTGRLKNSPRVRDEGDKMVLEITAPYAMALEFGTAYMAPRPSLGPAVAQIAEMAPPALAAIFSGVEGEAPGGDGA